MQNLLTQETPGKVMGFLGAAVFSMALLFGVSASSASFGGAEYALSDPFAPEKVMAVIDQVAKSYSDAVIAFAQPATEAVAVHSEQIQWIMAEASSGIVSSLGLNDLAAYKTPKTEQVAGAFTVSGSSGSFSVDTLYELVEGYYY